MQIPRTIFGGRKRDRVEAKPYGFVRPERDRADSLSQIASARFWVVDIRRTFRPVSIAVGARYRTASTVVDVGKLLLLGEWPDHRRAEMAVLDAVNDYMEPEEIRSAFLVAADEAHPPSLA
ncbi:hypothetical protein CPY51_00045 [Rhizobium tubonense]|uniref:DUF982 domain-containing protein n=1 Tax=Rhizobium tubonense TaxID=484088 RepID=A0A2W4CWG2_9HYPH|nr:hypothetical protein CPY51_00045 [Rhizobium tubonense]